MGKVTVKAGRVPHIVPASGKIYDITHADTNEHSVALPAGYPANTKVLYCRFARIAGTGQFRAASVSGVDGVYVSTQEDALWFRAVDGLFYYKLSAANDDWDIYSQGYITG